MFLLLQLLLLQLQCNKFGMWGIPIYRIWHNGWMLMLNVSKWLYLFTRYDLQLELLTLWWLKIEIIFVLHSQFQSQFVCIERHILIMTIIYFLHRYLTILSKKFQVILRKIEGVHLFLQFAYKPEVSSF